MSENSESEVEVDPYEEIVGPNLNYSTPMASRASSPLPSDKNESDMTHFNGPIVKCSESEVVSTSTGLVASVTWPDLRYPCSLAGKNSSATVAQHLDGNRLRASGCAFFLGVAGSTWNTMSRRPRPISVPSGILIHAAVWPQ